MQYIYGRSPIKAPNLDLELSSYILHMDGDKDAVTT